MAGLDPATHRARVRAPMNLGKRVSLFDARPVHARSRQFGYTHETGQHYDANMRVGHVYILASKPYGTLYIGVTNDLGGRVYRHRLGLASKFTKKYRVTRLVWYEEWPTVPEAIQRETSLKRWKRDWKIDLINKTNPEWLDLYETLA